eukprot:UN28021
MRSSTQIINTNIDTDSNSNTKPRKQPPPLPPRNSAYKIKRRQILKVRTQGQQPSDTTSLLRAPNPATPGVGMGNNNDINSNTATWGNAVGGNNRKQVQRKLPQYTGKYGSSTSTSSSFLSNSTNSSHSSHSSGLADSLAVSVSTASPINNNNDDIQENWADKQPAQPRLKRNSSLGLPKPKNRLNQKSQTVFDL